MLEIEQDKVQNHLEFLGYEVRRAENLIAAKHQSKPPMYVSLFDHGIVFNAVYSSSDAAKQDPLRLLKFVNSMNAETTMLRLFVRGDDQEVYFAAFYPGAYDKITFARFLEYWESDIGKLAASDETSRILK